MSVELGTTICKDQHRCDNGAKCIENTRDEGTYYCDCDVAGDDSTAFEGLYCEHKATEYCSDSHRKTTFCTNGSTCKKKGHSENKHFGCKCLDGYKGDHCQFTTNVPDTWPTMQLSSATTSTDSSKGIGPAAASVISLMVISVVFVIGFFGYRRYSTRQPSDTPVEQPDPGSTMAGSGDGVASLPHPDEVRQQMAEGTASIPKKTRSEPNAVMEGEDVDESTMEEVNMGNEII